MLVSRCWLVSRMSANAGITNAGWLASRITNAGNARAGNTNSFTPPCWAADISKLKHVMFPASKHSTIHSSSDVTCSSSQYVLFNSETFSRKDILGCRCFIYFESGANVSPDVPAPSRSFPFCCFRQVFSWKRSRQLKPPPSTGHEGTKQSCPVFSLVTREDFSNNFTSFSKISHSGNCKDKKSAFSLWFSHWHASWKPACSKPRCCSQ